MVTTIKQITINKFLTKKANFKIMKTLSQRKRINWTSPEVLAIVTKEIQATPGNLTSAFERIAPQIGVAAGTVMYNWYTFLRAHVQGFNVNSKSTKMRNAKNISRRKKAVVTFNDANLIHEAVVETKEVDGLRIVTIKKYFKD